MPVDYTTLLTAAANTTVAVAIAIYMVYWVTQKLNGKLDNINNKFDKIAEKLAEIAEKEAIIADRLERILGRK